VNQKRMVTVLRKRLVASEPVGSRSTELDRVLPCVSRTPPRLEVTSANDLREPRARGCRGSIARRPRVSRSLTSNPAGLAGSAGCSECRIGHT
jgi:hypothetical protein